MTVWLLSDENVIVLWVGRLGSGCYLRWRLVFSGVEDFCLLGFGWGVDDEGGGEEKKFLRRNFHQSSVL